MLHSISTLHVAGQNEQRVSGMMVLRLSKNAIQMYATTMEN
jgi:hypothetical protein